MTSAKVRIDVPSGIVELEGDEKFVTTYLDKLLPFIEAGGFGNAPGPDKSSADTSDKAAGNGKPRKKRRTPKRPPSGSSCRDRILILRKEGFFKSKRSPSDIVGGLEKKGWTYKGNQVGAALTTMFSSSEIQRTKEDKAFKYYYDRPD
jgi:hypothetical protein